MAEAAVPYKPAIAALARLGVIATEPVIAVRGANSGSFMSGLLFLSARKISNQEVDGFRLGFEVDRSRFVILTNRRSWTPIFVVYSHTLEMSSDHDALRRPR